ncbi:Inactive tyrosine-protein kinase 7, partial [Trichostrongylus colubriformis]
ARNCLISKEGIIKVSDFGLSVILENGKTMCKTILKEAPIRWLAPECCYKQPQFSKKSDVWAFGVLMFEVFSNGSKPFVDHEDLAIIRAIRKANMPPAPPDTPVLAASLMKQIWILKPDYRPTFEEIGKMLADIIQKSPPILANQMVVNQLKGVKREKLMLGKAAVHTTPPFVSTTPSREAVIHGKTPVRKK